MSKLIPKFTKEEIEAAKKELAKINYSSDFELVMPRHIDLQQIVNQENVYYCPKCNGSGGDKFLDCDTCGGEGFINV